MSPTATVKKTAIIKMKKTSVGVFHLSSELRVVDGEWKIVCFWIIGPWIGDEQIRKCVSNTDPDAHDKALAYFNEQVQRHGSG